MSQNPYVVRTVVLLSGERLPILIEVVTGQPLFEPTIYLLSELRATNKASNTIEQVLRSIMLLHLFLDVKQIDIGARLSKRHVVSLNEIDELIRQCRQPVSELLKSDATQRFSKRAHKRTSEVARFNQRKIGPIEVAGHTAANRVRVIRDYLDWLIRYHMARYLVGSDDGVRLWDEWKRCKDALNARIPRHKGRNALRQREGISKELADKLLRVTSPDSPENPWKGKGVRIRNYLLIRWLHDLGLRRGELLNLKISDINFQREEVIIARRADDPEDPRRDQPKVKTRDRKLPLSSSICKLTHSYITEIRRNIGEAKRHPYLFVAMGTGEPLSLSSVNIVFSDLREAFPGEFDALTPHVLRHTWNDRFSEKMNDTDVSETEEAYMRSFLMGWSPTSKTGATYTQRYIREKAQEVSLAMQTKQLGEKEKNE